MRTVTALRSGALIHSTHGVTLLEGGSSEHGMSLVTSRGADETLLSVHRLQASAASESSSSVQCVQRCHPFLLSGTRAVGAVGLAWHVGAEGEGAAWGFAGGILHIRGQAGMEGSPQDQGLV